MEHRVRMTVQHTECPSEVFLFVRDDMDVGFGVGFPEIAKRILGEIFEGAEVTQVLDVEPMSRVWSVMIDDARTDERFVRTTIDGRIYHGYTEKKWLFILGAN